MWNIHANAQESWAIKSSALQHLLDVIRKPKQAPQGKSAQKQGEEKEEEGEKEEEERKKKEREEREKKEREKKGKEKREREKRERKKREKKEREERERRKTISKKKKGESASTSFTFVVSLNKQQIVDCDRANNYGRPELFVSDFSVRAARFGR